MKLVIKNSAVLENGAAKPVTVAQMEFGEIALNYNTVDPTIFFKDSTNVIRGFKLGIQPDIDNANNQSGTYDDRYLRGDIGGTVSGDITATSFVGGVTRIGSAPPTATAPGELWYNTNDGRLYVYYQDADSAQWVDAAPDTFEFTQNYYTKTEANSLFAFLSGDNFTGTVNFQGAADAATVFTAGVGSTPFSFFKANGDFLSLSAGLGLTTDQGYKVSATGTFESYTPQLADGTTTKALRVFQGTSENAYISASGDAQFVAIYGDGTGITALGGVPVKAAYESNANTNAFTDADASKLDGIELGAQVNTVTSVNGLTGEVTLENVTDLGYSASARTITCSSGTDAILPIADPEPGNPGLMSALDKSKLDGIETGAQVNTVTSVNGQTGDVTVSGGGTGASVDIQDFVASGTWNKPADAKVVVVEVVGGGGGGGSGANNSGQSQAGGSGGAGGRRVVRTLFASDLNNTETVTVGTGGAGGSGVTNIGSNRWGQGGQPGQESSFGAHAIAGGGDEGKGGRNSTLDGGQGAYILQEPASEADIIQYLNASGGTSYAGVTGGSPGRYGYTSPGGGGGGGNTRSDGFVYPAGEGGLGLINERGASTINHNGGGVPRDNDGGSYNGGGGGSGESDGGNANAGGNGGFPGGGGGGGGAAFEPGVNGDGGDGGAGFVRVITYF